MSLTKSEQAVPGVADVASTTSSRTLKKKRRTMRPNFVAMDNNPDYEWTRT